MTPLGVFDFSLNVLYICLGIQLSLFDFSMKMDLAAYGMSINQISMIVPIILLGWLLKFIPACISDIYKLRGVDRAFIIACATLFAGFMFDYIVAGFRNVYGYVLCLAVSLFLLAIADVNYDAWLVRRIRIESNDEKGNTQMYNNLSRKIGGFLGDALGPVAWGEYGSRGVYGFISVMCYVISLIVLPFFIKASSMHESRAVTETSQDEYLSLGEVVKRVKNTILHKAVFMLLIVCILQHLIPNPQYAIFFYMVGPLQFTPAAMSKMMLASSIIPMFATLLYRCMYRVPINLIMLVSCIFICIGTLLPLTYTKRISVDLIWKEYGERGRAFLNETYNYTEYHMLEPYLNDTYLYSDIMHYDVFTVAIIAESMVALFKEIRFFPMVSLTYMLSDKKTEATTVSIIFTILNVTGGAKWIISGIITKAFNIDYYNFEKLPDFIAFTGCAEILLCLATFACLDRRSLLDIEKEEEGGTPIAETGIEITHAEGTIERDRHMRLNTKSATFDEVAI